MTNENENDAVSGNGRNTESSWPGAFENVGCGGMVFIFIVWLVGTVVTANPLWFKG